MWNLKNKTSEQILNRNRLMDTEIQLVVGEGRVGGGGPGKIVDGD